MTQVAFHFGAPDKLAYVCRLLRKATSAGAKSRVRGDAATVESLDHMLWVLAATDFVSHCSTSSSVALQRHSSVLLTQGDGAATLHQGDVLLNLQDDVPASVANYGRVIEVVSIDEDDRRLARQRWKTYAAAGYAITRHDIALKG